LPKILYLAGRGAVADAASLIEIHGDAAADAAAARADASRSRGNYIHFCHWRQIERLIDWLATDAPVGAVH
jgi:hypothetical protein